MNNKDNKITKKVGEGKYDHYGHYGHPTAIVGKEKIKFHEMRSRETMGNKKIWKNS